MTSSIVHTLNWSASERNMPTYFPSDTVELATVTSVPVLLIKMRCMFFLHCQDLFVHSLRRKYSFLFFPFCQSFSMEAPYIPHALPTWLTSRQTIFDFLSHRHNIICCFIPDIMDYFLVGEDLQQTNQPNDRQ